MKICPTCSNEFQSTLVHKKCPSCKHEFYKKNCACGNKINHASTTCVSCAIQLQKGPLNNNWKGGKTYHKKGYCLLKITKHPRAISNHGYVFEHILVMEEYLGRYLLLTENIHHKNGIKNDNRIQNLELWIKPQPSGIRMEDAITWAKSILAQYDPDSLKL